MVKYGSGAWTGFLVMAFIILGLCGLFATYAVQLPYQREAYSEARLDAASGAPDAQARLDQLRDALGDDGTGAFPPDDVEMSHRIDTARHVLRRHFQDQGNDIALRLRIVIVVFTGGATLFGLMVTSILRRAPR